MNDKHICTVIGKYYNLEDALDVIRKEGYDIVEEYDQYSPFKKSYIVMKIEPKQSIATNGDRIRAMRDEELADFIRQIKLIAIAGDRIGLDTKTLVDVNWMQKEAPKSKCGRGCKSCKND